MQKGQFKSTIPSSTGTTNSLLADEKIPVPATPVVAKHKRLKLVVGIGLGIVGAGAGVLYLGPSKQCALEETCGAWLSSLTSEEFAKWTFFLSGATGYGGMSAYFAANSVEQYVDYVSLQPKWRGKILKASVIVLLAATQSLQTYLLAASDPKTKADPLLLSLIMMGAVPTALYGTVKLVKTVLPYAYSKMKHGVCSRNSHAINYYEAQRDLVIEQMTATLQAIMADTKNIQPGRYKTPLELLARHYRVSAPESWVMYLAQKAVKGLALAITAAFSAPILKNSYSELGDMNAVLKAFVVFFLGAASLYAHTKHIGNFFSSGFDVIRNVLSRQPINSAIFQLRMKTMMAVIALIHLTQALSYAVICQKWNKQVRPDIDTLKIAALVGVCVYHIDGLLAFIRARYKDFTSDDKAKLLLAAEDLVAELGSMPIEKYIAFIEKMSPDLQECMRISLYAIPDDEFVALDVAANSPSVAVSSESKNLKTDTAPENVAQPAAVKSTPPLSPRMPRQSPCEKFFSFSWLPFFGGASTEDSSRNDVDLDNVSSTKYQPIQPI